MQVQSEVNVRLILALWTEEVCGGTEANDDDQADEEGPPNT